ncbi:hypothetical protein [Flavobacterium sp. F52]|uniref:hypothetical protein n=1 Tax=Flavobacterium sp. F52 TaxID=1202532 RepID=UPI000272DF72|nr:hypothetical protein [Flavobacterium sp. F52]EJG03395.1 hypothetical protein FF52_00560 [Flavobacterium sp. F52]
MSKKNITVPNSILKTVGQMDKFNNSIAGKHLKDFNKHNQLNVSNSILKLATEINSSKTTAKALSNYKIIDFKASDLLSQIHKSVQDISVQPNLSKMTFSDFKYISADNILKSLKSLDTHVSNFIDASYEFPLAINQELMEAINYTEENVSVDELQEIEKIIDDTNAIIDDAFQETEKQVEILMSYLNRLSESKIASKAKEYTIQVLIAIVANILYAIIAEKMHLVQDKPSVVVNQYKTIINVNHNVNYEEALQPTTEIFSKGKTYVTLIEKKLEKSRNETLKNFITIPAGSKIILRAVYVKWVEVSVFYDGQEKMGFTTKDGLVEID